MEEPLPDHDAVACTWRVEASQGLETAWVTLDDHLAAHGRAVGLTPSPYWVTYTLETGDHYVTRRLAVQVESAAGVRGLELLRSADGSWQADGRALPADLAGALDCDLAFCPLTNTMPILRHRLHQREGTQQLVMAWVSLPDLTVHRSEQGYQHLRRTSDGAVVRFTAGSFTADIVVDRHGLVVRYPQLATRLAHTSIDGPDRGSR